MAILDSTSNSGGRELIVTSILNNFALLKLRSTAVEQRLVLCKRMALYENRSIPTIILNYGIFGLIDATPMQRFELFASIVATIGDDVIYIPVMFNNIDKFGLEQVDSDLLMSFFYKTLDQGPLGKRVILSAIEKLRPLINSFQMLELCKRLINDDINTIEKVMVQFSNLSLGNQDTISFIRFMVTKGGQKEFLNTSFFKSILDLRLKRQILVDLLIPPSGLRGIPTAEFQLYSASLNGKDAEISNTDIVIEILNKKPGELNKNDILRFKGVLKSHPKLSFLEAFVEKIETNCEANIKKNIEKDALKSVQEGEEKIRRDAEFTKCELITWVAYVASVFADCEDDLIAALTKTKVLDHISSYSHPSLRYTFVREFSRLRPTEVINYYSGVIHPKSGVNKEIVASKNHAANLLEKQTTPFTQLQKPAFLLAPLANFGQSSRSLAALQYQILNTRSMKQLSVSSALAQLLSSVAIKGPYNVEEADKISDCIIKALKQPEILGKTKKKVVLAVQEGEEKLKQEARQITKEEQTQKDLEVLINILEFFGKDELIKFVRPENNHINAVAFFQNLFRKIFTVDEFPDFIERYQETFGRFRDPLAIYTYCQSVNRLPNDTKMVVMATLNAYVNAVLRGNFEEVRSDPANSAHLQRIYTARPDLQLLWNKSLAPKAIVFTEADVKENEELSKKSLHVAETVDPCDLLLLGEIAQSCQSVRGVSGNNQALVSYLMNGEIRAFVIKEGDNVVARILLRLMWDEKTQCPVLLHERYYSNFNMTSFLPIIAGFLTEKAEMMGLNLVTLLESDKFKPYPGSVKFLGGYAPVGYSDSGGGLIRYLKQPTILENDTEATFTAKAITAPANAAFEVVGAKLIFISTQFRSQLEHTAQKQQHQSRV